jgi:hypothetical protein
MIASYLGARVGKAEGQADLFPRTFNTKLNKAQDCVMVKTLIKMQHSMLKQMQRSICFNCETITR